LTSSDGLSTDLGHICDESGVGAEIEAAAIPVAVKPAPDVDLDFALHGGEDYELLFTAPQGKRVPSWMAELRQAGRADQAWPGVFLKVDGVKRKLPPQGWEHFQRA